MDFENNPQIEAEQESIPPTSSPEVSPVPLPQILDPRPSQDRRRPSGSLLALAAMLVVGGVLGYLGRPYLDQRVADTLVLNNTGSAVEPVAITLATNTTLPTMVELPTATLVVTNVEVAPIAVAPTDSALPVLITPMPDQSAAINAFIVSNTRHFTGNSEAKVTIIEFSDFQ